MTTINYAAEGKNLFKAPNGAIVGLSIDGSDLIVGVAFNHESSDGYEVSTFSTFVSQIDTPIIVMTNENPHKVYTVLANSMDEFFAQKSRGSHFHFVEEACEHHGWVFHRSAALNCAYHLSENFSFPIENPEIIPANMLVKASRDQFYSYIKGLITK